MFKRVALLLVLSTAPAFAQAPDPAFLQKAVNALQTQRNSAMDAQAVAEAKLQIVTDDLAKANAKIKELEEAAEKKAPDKK